MVFFFSCRDPIPVPEKVRKPLTEVQEFNHHVDHRAVDRSEFDQKVKNFYQLAWKHGFVCVCVCVFFFFLVLIKVYLQIKEKEMMYKRYREESEASRMVWM